MRWSILSRSVRLLACILQSPTATLKCYGAQGTQRMESRIHCRRCQAQERFKPAAKARSQAHYTVKSLSSSLTCPLPYGGFSLFLGSSTAWMLGRTTPCVILTLPSSLLSSSSLQIASCRWCAIASQLQDLSWLPGTPAWSPHRGICSHALRVVALVQQWMHTSRDTVLI